MRNGLWRAGRRRSGPRPGDAGFTLVELTVVVVVIGILAAIAIPLYLRARRVAVDAQTKSDLTHVAQTIINYYGQNISQPVIYGQIHDNRTIRIAAANFAWQQDVPVTYGTIVTSFSANANASNWCIAMGNGAGSAKTWKYTNAGMAIGSCPAQAT